MDAKRLSLLERAAKLFPADRFQEKKTQVMHRLKTTYDIDYVEYDDVKLKGLLNEVVFPLQTENLFTKYIMPPFSVLDTRSGEWLKRRDKLQEHLGSSLAGRREGLAYDTRIGADYRLRVVQPIREDDNGTSQFDALLCELILKWFGFAGANVYDSFAGGHVRGTMAQLLKQNYFGIELSTEQVAANRKRAAEMGLKDVWTEDDSLNVGKYLKDDWADLFFTCPPYGDLEKYTDKPEDLSNMSYKDFKTAYREIIARGCKVLKNNRFAVFVVGDFRDEKGFYRGFVADTIQAFEDCGVKLYNEVILLNSLGTAPMRAGAAFRNRKMTKVHQNILVFYKGDPDKISENYTNIDSNLPFRDKVQAGLL